jgi:hypothetical protein
VKPSSEDEVADLARTDRIDPRGGFVEDDETRILDEGLGQSDALEHALRIAGEPPRRGGLEVDELEQFRDAVLEVPAAHAAEFSVEAQRLRPGEVLVEVGILGEETDLVPRPDVARVEAEDAGLSLARGHQAEDDLHRRRLARTVRPDQSVDLARVDAEGEVVDRNDIFLPQSETEDLGEILDFDGGGAHGLVRSRVIRLIPGS